MAEKKIEKIEDLPGVGATTAEKLKTAGYTTLAAIAVASPMELGEIAALGDATAVKAINAAREALEMGYESADKLLEKRGKLRKLTLGAEAFDNLLSGGLETQSITEAYGQYGSGKSQIAHQLAVNVQLPFDKGGLDGNCLFIDTENTFRPERIKQMAIAKGLDVDTTLKNVFVGRAYNSDHQMLLVEKSKDLIKERNIKLIIVDSLTAHFRAEYTGRGKLAERQQKLNRHLHALQRIGDLNDLVIYVTNQVMSRPDIMFGDPTAAIGGNVVAHTATYRLYLRRSKAEKRVVKLVDSPNLPDGEALIRVTNNGIEDE